MTTIKSSALLLDPLASRASALPDSGEIALADMSAVDKIVGLYKEYFAYKANKGQFWYCWVEDHLKEVIVAPHEITMFWKIVTGPEPDLPYLNEESCKFAMRLVQNSYDAGHNGFVMGEGGDRGWPRSMACGLKGTKDRPLEYRLTGSAPDHFGGCASYCDFTILGGAEPRLGAFADHCRFYVAGDASYELGERAEYCSFTLEGDVKREIGEKSEHCVFQSHRGKTYGQIITALKEMKLFRQEIYHPVVKLLAADESVIREWSRW